MSATLSCSHPPTEPRPAHTTGYAVASDGRKMCFACADDAERAALRRATRFDGGGSVWHGQSAGPGMVATMRLSKRQPTRVQ